MYTITLSTNIGVLLVRVQGTKSFKGNYEECLNFYNTILVQNLIFGWWSPLSLIMNPLFMLDNRRIKKELDAIHNKTIKNNPS